MTDRAPAPWCGSGAISGSSTTPPGARRRTRTTRCSRCSCSTRRCSTRPGRSGATRCSARSSALDDAPRRRACTSRPATPSRRSHGSRRLDATVVHLERRRDAVRRPGGTRPSPQRLDAAREVHHGTVVHPPGSITTAEGTVPRVFTAFWRRWQDRDRSPDRRSPADATVAAPPRIDRPPARRRGPRPTPRPRLDDVRARRDLADYPERPRRPRGRRDVAAVASR